MALIYVVEDDNDILEIETFALKNSNYEVKGFSNAKDFYEAIEEKVPSLAVLDVMLPDEDGLQIVQKVRSIPKMANLPIIMVTARTTEIDKVKGLDIGADDYLTKPFGVMELIARVKALLRRTGVQEDKKQLKLEEIIMDDEKHAVFVNEKQCELTYKEYEFLKMLLENIGIVLKRESIMSRIWGTDYMGETRTVDMHIKTLRQKLGEAGNHIKTVRNVGYMIE
ncbi:MAG: response regulator transcription factor [Lachnospiraceae bacterium]|nr:response regulator transcription factor [Lachnospiraceae bacterium]MEE1257006.1 response regulator transcription factor [Lachnospiraceae bacterium]